MQKAGLTKPRKAPGLEDSPCATTAGKRKAHAAGTLARGLQKSAIRTNYIEKRLWPEWEGRQQQQQQLQAFESDIIWQKCDISEKRVRRVA
jgi:hypothetical protein